MLTRFYFKLTDDGGKSPKWFQNLGDNVLNLGINDPGKLVWFDIVDDT